MHIQLLTKFVTKFSNVSQKIMYDKVTLTLQHSTRWTELSGLRNLLSALQALNSFPE
jgi:hypothetical protein